MVSFRDLRVRHLDEKARMRAKASKRSSANSYRNIRSMNVDSGAKWLAGFPALHPKLRSVGNGPIRA